MELPEGEFLKKGVAVLREKEKRAARYIRKTKYKIPWDIDWLKLSLRDHRDGMPFSINGIDVILLPNKLTSPPGKEIGIYIEDFMLFQFTPPQDLEKILQVYRAFGTCIISRFPDKELDELIHYCNKVDEQIVDFAHKCSEAKISNIFEKVWKEMGGDAIRQDDRLGKRIEYYKEILFRFKKNRKEFEVEINDLKLLG